MLTPKHSRTRYNLIFGLIFMGVCSWLIIQKPEIILQLRSLWEGDHPIYVIGHLGSLVFTFALFVSAWRLCIHSQGEPCPWRTACFSWLVPNLGKYIPGKLLMLGARVEIMHKHSVRRSITSAAMMFEHMAMIIAAAPFILIVVFTSKSTFSLPACLIATLALLIPISAVVIYPQFLMATLNYILRRTRRAPLQHRPSRKKLLHIIMLHAIAWLIYGISGHLLLTALLPNANVPVWITISAFPAAWLIGFVSILTPGGLGVREAVLVFTLGRFITTEAALSLAIASRATWTFVEMLGVAVGWIASKRANSAIAYECDKTESGLDADS